MHTKTALTIMAYASGMALAVPAAMSSPAAASNTPGKRPYPVNGGPPVHNPANPTYPVHEQPAEPIDGGHNPNYPVHEQPAEPIDGGHNPDYPVHEQPAEPIDGGHNPNYPVHEQPAEPIDGGHNPNYPIHEQPAEPIDGGDNPDFPAHPIDETDPVDDDDDDDEPSTGYPVDGAEPAHPIDGGLTDPFPYPGPHYPTHGGYPGDITVGQAGDACGNNMELSCCNDIDQSGDAVNVAEGVLSGLVDGLLEGGGVGLASGCSKVDIGLLIAVTDILDQSCKQTAACCQSSGDAQSGLVNAGLPCVALGSVL